MGVGQNTSPPFLSCSCLEPRRPLAGCRGSRKQYHPTPHPQHTQHISYTNDPVS